MKLVVKRSTRTNHANCKVQNNNTFHMSRKCFDFFGQPFLFWIITVTTEDDQPVETWYRAKDIALFFGYTYPSQAIYRYIKPEWKKDWDYFAQKILRAPKYWRKDNKFLSIQGVYLLSSYSKLSVAKYFGCWVSTQFLLPMNKNCVIQTFFNDSSYTKNKLFVNDDNTGYVYIATTESYRIKYKCKVIYKIGKTVNVQKRLSAINSTRYGKDIFKLVKAWKLKNNYHDVEKYIFTNLRNRHEEKEFYSFDNDIEAVRILSQFIIKYKQINNH